MTIKNYIWDQIKRDFKSGIPEPEFETWLSRVSLKKIDQDQAIIEVPNQFVARWLQDHYIDQIQTVFRKNLKTLPKIRFTTTASSKQTGLAKKKAHADSGTSVFQGINPMSTFSSFVTASSNRLAYSSALHVAEGPSNNYNPLYIFSELSLGKTHLLNAIGNLVIKKDPFANIIYLSTDRFVRDFLSSDNTIRADHFWEREGCPDFLLIDNLQMIAEHKKPQEEFLALCSSFLESDKQLAIAATSPPGKIPNLLPQLRSRLEWGLITEINTPSQRTKMKIIKNSAKQKDLTLSDNVIFFLANATDNLKTLNKYLVKLDAYASPYKRPIDISVVDSIIKKKNHPVSDINLRQIQRVTAKYFNIALRDLLSSKREKTFSYPRQVAIYLSKKLTSYSLKEIGNAFGNKHHSTIIYAVKRIEQGKSQNKGTLNDINTIQMLITRTQGS